MVHQDFQEAIEQVSLNESMDSEEIKKHFNLSQEDMMAMKSNEPSLETKAPRAVGLCCCCCYQSEN